MAKKSKKPTNNNESEFITIEVTNYHASVSAALNYELANIKWCNDDTFLLTLKDCHSMDGFARVYKTVKGERVPVYELPDSVGFLEKRRGQNCWAGHTWVPPRTVTDMLIMLPHMKPLYLEIHRLKREKLYIMRSVSLMTNNPIDS